MPIKKKTELMLRVQRENDDELIETLVPRVVQEKGVTQAASGLGISKATMSTWILKLGLSYERTLAPLGSAGSGEPNA